MPLCYNETSIEDGGNTVNYWMIVSVALALICAGTCIVYIQQRKELLLRKEHDGIPEQLRQEMDHYRRENVTLRRETAALYRALEDEQNYADDLEQELDEQYARLVHAEQRAERAEARRTDAEKEIYAGRMRSDLLERQLKELQDNQLAQEQLYQDIIRERDLTIAKLQESQPKRKPNKKKPDILDQQVTLEDLIGA